jgi:hypothetical protein
MQKRARARARPMRVAMRAWLAVRNPVNCAQRFKGIPLLAALTPPQTPRLEAHAEPER